MSAARLAPLDLPALPVDAPCLTPDRVAGLSEREIRALPLLVGNRRTELGELFAVRGAGGEELRIEGDVSRVRRIGAGMTGGRVLVDGAVGPHAGARMAGGTLEVRGDAAAWAGAEMAGGVLRIAGDAGPGAGAAYPGARRGMSGGALLVEGAAGPGLGEAMRRGLIAVRGRAGPLAGLRMIAGTILLLSGAEEGAGAGMRRGTILAAGPLDLLPTFRPAGEFRPEWVRILVRRLREGLGFAVDARYGEGPWQRWSGDFNELGRGEILAWTSG